LFACAKVTLFSIQQKKQGKYLWMDL